MKARFFSVSPDFWVMLCKNPHAFRLTAGRLPEDAKLSHVDSFVRNRNNEDVYEFRIWVESAAFDESDPDMLPNIQFTDYPKGTDPWKPVE